MVYKLAAPGGPIPCYRFGTRIVFELDDLQAYKQSCKVNPLPPLPLPRLRPRSVSIRNPDGESSLRKTFEKLGITPRRTLK
uniref:hypothetical protein n=1 Tax=Rhodoferax sp. GW822-FHT02A01 TaxID=3141537 RepID=UPI00406CCEBB